MSQNQDMEHPGTWNPCCRAGLQASYFFSKRMSAATKRSFTALLEREGTALNWVVARVPFDIAKVWPGRKGRRVRGEIEGSAFRTTLVSSPHGGGLVLVVNRKMLSAVKARAGDKVRITLEPDLEERPVEIPAELTRVMRGEKGFVRWFGQLSPSMRREIGKWVGEPKSAESRQRRAEKMAERLYLTMEGEVEPPPVLLAAFERQPLARAGWEALTPAQRRSHLLGVFYYETAEGRQRRAAKAIEDALRAAGKGGGNRSQRAPEE